MPKATQRLDHFEESVGKTIQYVAKPSNFVFRTFPGYSITCYSSQLFPDGSNLALFYELSNHVNRSSQ